MDTWSRGAETRPEDIELHRQKRSFTDDLSNMAMHRTDAIFDLEEDKDLMNLYRQSKVLGHLHKHLLPMSSAIDGAEDILQSVWMHGGMSIE